MISIFKNNFYRALERKNYIIVSLIMSVVSIFMAIYFTAHADIKGNIAVISKTNSSVFTNYHSKHLNITVLKKEPDKSELVMNKYDAVVIDKGNRAYSIDTIKGNDFKKMILEALKNKNIKFNKEDNRGIGANIVGYLTMFLLMQGVLYMFTFGEDREQKQIIRISISPLSFTKYISGQFLFTFFITMVPAYLILFGIKIIFRFKLGFGMLQYLALLSIICALSSAFALFLNSLTQTADTANMMGSVIAMVTSVLSGSFYSFGKSNAIFNKITWLLPQKGFLNFVQGLEKGKAVFSMLPQITYVIGVTALLVVFSIVKNKMDYIQHNE